MPSASRTRSATESAESFCMIRVTHVSIINKNIPSFLGSRGCHDLVNKEGDPPVQSTLTFSTLSSRVLMSFP
jgi:hypothetical protein